MALTPAREYYGSQIVDGLDPSEQWSRKKQTKEQKKAAKKAKLDPANQKSALDIIQERERKRKRELGMEDAEDGAEANGNEAEAGAKRQKTEHDEEAKRRLKAERRKEKRQLKKEKMTKKKARADAKKAAKEEEDMEELQAQSGWKALRQAKGQKDDGEEEMDVDDPGDESDAGEMAADVEAFDASGLADGDGEMDAPATIETALDGKDTLSHDDEDEEKEDGEQEASSVPTSPAGDSPAFDRDTNRSTASSSSSILPPTAPEEPTDPPATKAAPAMPAINTAAHTKLENLSRISSPKIQLPDIDQAELQERLRQRIEALRAQRKADGPDGKPAKSRQELLDQRRKKEEQRKAAKKEQRRKAKEDEQRKREEQLRGSGSPMSVDMFSPRIQEPNFSFSRLAFDDGTAADASLTTLNDAKKRKGPQDPKTALEAANKKAARLAGLDPEQRADIAEKDLWLNAKKRAHGERVRDDTSLLKKALKRKEKQKGKSERAWKEREEGVVKGKEMKQKKREANLAKRREEKGGGGKKAGGKKGGGGGKKKGRPGFEGRFKA